ETQDQAHNSAGLDIRAHREPSRLLPTFYQYVRGGDGPFSGGGEWRCGADSAPPAGGLPGVARDGVQVTDRPRPADQVDELGAIPFPVGSPAAVGDIEDRVERRVPSVRGIPENHPE